MAVVLSPSTTLGFERPLTRLVPQLLTVHNPNSQPTAVKIKTTAPKSYSVRPSAARVEPGETVQIHIVLQPLKEEPPAGSRSRDKFLVQSTLLTPERETLGLQNVWSAVPPGDVHEQKVRVAWASDASAAASPAGVAVGNGSSPATPVAPTAIGSGAGAGLTAPASATTAADSRGVSSAPTEPFQSSRSAAAGAPAPAPAPPTAPTSASTFTPAKASEKPLSTPELQAKVNALQQQVAVAQSERGVPTQTVALVSLFIFVLAYIFF